MNAAECKEFLDRLDRTIKAIGIERVSDASRRGGYRVIDHAWEMIKAMAGEDRYAQRIRGAVSAFWRGAIDRGEFDEMLGRTIRAGLEAAYAEGAAEFGVTPDEYTDADKTELQAAITNEWDAMSGFAETIAAESRANRGKLQPLLDRAALWAARYTDVRQRAKVVAGADRKFVWTLGPTEHCPTCASLAGIVHRGSQWRNYVMPREISDRLCCGGFRCQCTLEETTARASRKYPPVPGNCTTKMRGP